VGLDVRDPVILDLENIRTILLAQAAADACGRINDNLCHILFLLQ
jgi:hypothetical protein